MAIRLSGLSSGLDTEAIVTQLVSAYSTKKDKYVKAQTKLSWKQDAWKTLNSKIFSLYTNISSLRFSSAYTMKKATVSDSSKAKITAKSNTMNGTQSLEIEQVAKSGYLTGAKLKKGTSASSTLEDLGFDKSGVITVTSGGVAKNIQVSGDTKISQFIDDLNASGVSANFDAKNGRIFIGAKGTGVENDFSLTASTSDGLKALQTLGLSADGSAADLEKYEAFAKYAKGMKDGVAVDYFQKDAAGNLLKGPDGKYLVTAGATYSEEATKQNIDEIRDKVEKNSAEMTELQSALSYSSAYQNVEDIHEKFLQSGEKDNWDLFTELLNLSDPSSVYVDSDGNTYDASKVKANDDGSYTYDDGNGQTKTFQKDELTHGAVRLAELETAAGIAQKNVNPDGSTNFAVDSDAVSRLKSDLRTKKAYEDDPANQSHIEEISREYASGGLDDLTKGWREKIREDLEYNDANMLVSNMLDSSEFVAGQVGTAVEALEHPAVSEGASKVDGQDAIILLNGAEFTSSSNEMEINGLTIEALGKTDGELTVTVSNDVSGLYDKVKGFIKEYNELINEMMKLYNADSASGYEPLTDEEKEAMTESEIDKWEEKIKGALFRRDSTLDSVIHTMTNAMAKQYNINGKNYSLGTFGITTLGLFDSAKNEQYAYHIYGDSEDTAVSGKEDKLMAALKDDPESVVEFMKKLTDGLYTELDKKMKSSRLSSAYTVYNDKEMDREYSDYTDTIKKWDDKLTKMEDSYYKKFSQMEKALAQLQAQQSSLGNLFSS